jgi:uncharacterized protein (DUF1330 family)
MNYHAVAEINITRAGSPNYVQRTTRLVEQRGGCHLARTPHLEKLEGDRPSPQLLLSIE